MLDAVFQHYFHAKINSIEPVTSSTHQVFHLHLADKTEWLLKILAKENWLGTINEPCLKLSEVLGCQMMNQLSQKYTSMLPPTSVLFANIGDQLMLIKNYCPGRPLSLYTSERAYLLGQILASIHKIALHPEYAQPLPVALCWSNPPKNLVRLYETIQQFADYQQECWVFSHRDLTRDNLLWMDNALLGIIDWESAGLIHPFIELIGLACNCARILEFQFDQNLFQTTMAGYQSQCPLPEADDILWAQMFTSWFIWISYLDKRKKNQEKEESIKVIHYLQYCLPMLQKLYRKLQINN